MGEKLAWLRARKRHKQIVLWLKKILGGSVIAALIVGPLIYFGVAAQETAQILEGDLRNKALQEATATPEVKTSKTPIEFPKKVEVKKPEKREDLNIEIKDAKIPEMLKEPELKTQSFAANIEDETKDRIALEFKEKKEDIEIKKVEFETGGLKEESVIINDVSIDYGPAEIKIENDANGVARNTLQKYLNTIEGGDKIAVLKDTSKLEQVTQPDALVISSVKHNNGKWYVDFVQYHNLLPVFDGNAKLIFTEKKKLLVLTDNVRRNLPAPEEFKVGTAVAQQSTKELFEWNDSTDEVQFINKGYYKEKPAYKVETDVHNPLGQWDVYVNGVDGNVEGLISDIRTQDTPLPTEEPAAPVIEEQPAESVVTEEPTPQEQPTEPETGTTEETITEPETTPTEETPEAVVEPEEILETPTEILTTEEPATTEPEILPPEMEATPELEIEILQTLLSQVFGKIYPKTPNDAQEILPFSNEYVYINQSQLTTDAQGYFDNPTMSWYSLFLEGPYVTVHDDDATMDVETVDQTPEDPFTWDENTASLAAINAFYHTNKIREWALTNLGFEINDTVPVTVNSQLVDSYLMGCGAWFDTRDNTIEIGRGGYEGEINGTRSPCGSDLNYALSSDIIYHEYAHHIVESVTHLPNIQGAESAAMGEALADYFAATINDDSVWGDVVSVRTRDLNNTLKYKYIDDITGQVIEGQTDMTGDAHYDGQILSGALWDLRTAIGAETTDKLIFNTLYQGRLHYETFMYGMIIEDDDNNDFSDGTPHLIAILEAFEKHGIGPGVLNFSGLPIDPEEWTKLLQEAGYEGEENPLLLTHSGDCTTGGTSPNTYLNATAGGTCYVTASETWDYVNVYGTLVIGSESGAATTLTVNSDVMVQGGTIAIGYSTTADYSATLSVGGDLWIYNSTGLVYTRSNTNTSPSTVNNSVTVSGIIYAGSNTGNIGELRLVDATTLNTAGTLYVYGTFHVYNGARLTVTNHSYLHGSTNSHTTIDSGGSFYSAYIDMGETDASPNGGDIDNTGTISVTQSIDVEDAAVITNNSGGVIDVTSSSAVTYSMEMYDACSITNDGTVRLERALYLGEQVSAGSGPTFTNNGTLDMSEASPDLNDLRIQADGQLINSSTATQVLIADDVYLSGSADILNYDYFYIGNTGASHTSTSILEITAGTTFTNYSGGTFDASTGDATLYGTLNVYSTGSFTNNATAIVDKMLIGSSGNGGYVYNNSGGSFQVYSSGSDAASVSGGHVYNYSGATLFDINGTLEITGVAGVVGVVTNEDNNFTLNTYLTVSNYGTFDNNSTGTAQIDGQLNAGGTSSCLIENDGSVTVNNIVAMSGDCALTNNSGGTFNAGVTAGTGQDLSMAGSSHILNYGTINVYDDLYMGEEISGGSAYIYNYNAINLTSSTNNKFTMNGTSTALYNYCATNYPIIDVSYGSGSDTDGVIEVFDGSYIENYCNVSGQTATIKGHSIAVGVDGTTAGGSVSNKVRGTILLDSTSSSTPTVDIYMATILNDYAATNFSIGGGIGNIRVNGTSADRGYFTSYALSLGGLEVKPYGTTTFGTTGVTCTFTNGTDVVNATAHGLPNGTKIRFRNSGGGLPTGLNDYTDYYVISAGTNTFQVSLTLGGAAVNFTTDGTGTNYFHAAASHGGSANNVCSVLGVRVSSTNYNGTVDIKPGSTFHCLTMNIGNTTPTDPGRVTNEGIANITTVNIYADNISSFPDTEYEFNQPSAYGMLTATTINIGNGTVGGGQLRNIAGDGYLMGSDSNDDGIYATNIYVNDGGNLLNGNASNRLAEIDWTTDANGNLSLYDNGTVTNYGKIGSDYIAIIAASPDAVFNNEYIAGVYGGQVGRYGQSGTYTNTTISLYDGTFNNKGGSATADSALVVATTLNIFQNNIFNNNGDAIAEYLYTGQYGTSTGGTLNNLTYGDVQVNNTTSSAAETYCGTVNINDGSYGFDVYGRMSVRGSMLSCSGTINIQNSTTTPATTMGDLYIYTSGTVDTYDELDITTDNGGTGHLEISGAGMYPGYLVIEATNGYVYVDGTTTVASVGYINNKSHDAMLPIDHGLYTTGLVTVNSGGYIISDNPSTFRFAGGFTSAGTVEMDDNIETTGTFTVTAGTTTAGTTSNAGSLTVSGKTTVSGGTFTSYEFASIHDVEVTGSGTNAYFNNDSGNACWTDIHGYLDILNSGKVTINCKTTSPSAVDVHAGSPGGTTYVLGTLVINTNLETDDMIVGDGSTTSGLVTHDEVAASTPYITDDTDVVFNLLVNNDLTVNSNGSMDVSSKSRYLTSPNITASTYYFAGTYGGKGQTDYGTLADIQEYGCVTFACENPLYADFGKAGKTVGGTGTTMNGRGGGKMRIVVYGDIINNGTIAANGEDHDDGGGSGGSIIIIVGDSMFQLNGTITGSGTITANGGSRATAVPPYPITSYAGGGGGRIYIMYLDKSGYSGTIQAQGGSNKKSSTRYGGSGTIFLQDENLWTNQPDGVLIMDNGDHPIDVNVNGTTDINDATEMPTYGTSETYVTVESIQVANAGQYSIERDPGFAFTVTKTRQCVVDSNSNVYSASTDEKLSYNRDHTVILSQSCMASPDPPGTQYINTTHTGAQSGVVGDKGSSVPTVVDLTPNASAIHIDGTTDLDGTLITPTHSVYQYQVQIAHSLSELSGGTIITDCNLDAKAFDAAVANSSRSEDLMILQACGENLAAESTYYWRIRYMEDQDGDTGTTTDQYWGIWSVTNRFKVGTGGDIWTTSCTSGTDSIVLDDILLPTVHTDSDSCTIAIDTTVPSNIVVQKSQTLTSGSDTIPDMIATDSELDGDTTNEVAFRIGTFSTPVENPQDYTVLTNSDNSKGFSALGCPGMLDICWHQLKTTPSSYTVLTNTTGGIMDDVFSFIFGAYINNDQYAGTYTSAGTITLWSNP